MSDFTTLESFVDRNVCEPFVRHIRFPQFKNLEPGLRIEFEYPITALVGVNGTNKSSILRALQGCPSQYNIGDYWFDTELDPISEGDPHRYIHGYFVASQGIVEVIKARVGKTSRGADYFETSAPRVRDGMAKMPPESTQDQVFRNKTRWRPIDKNVVYLDFRQEIPAYDILSSFNWRKRDNDIDSKKRRIRKNAPHVARALDVLAADQRLYGANRILEPADELTADELACLSQILGRKYTSVRMVRHDYFGVEGYTAAISTQQMKYSEAYAGSGEFAAIMLVRAVSRAPERSLIILDEPETSLHPGAQRELIAFIARQCVLHKHQVVLATHAPSIVTDLPSGAIKLLDVSPGSGRVALVSGHASPSEAFVRLGVEMRPRSAFVEDELAAELVRRAARTLGQDFLDSISVRAIPGGAQSILKRVVPVAAATGQEAVILLDGDQRPVSRPRAAVEVADSRLELELDKIGLARNDVFQDGGSASAGSAQVHTRLRQALEWAETHLDYLPGDSNPEVAILEAMGEPGLSNGEAKTRWVEITTSRLGLGPAEAPDARDILHVQREELAALDDESEIIIQIQDLLARLLPPTT